MKNQRGLTGTLFLNVMLIYCLVRFGLVFTTTISWFRIPFVVMAGAGLVFLFACVNRKYAGQLLQANFLCLIINILSVFVLRYFITISSYEGIADNYINQLIVLAVLWGLYLYMRWQSAHSRKWFAGIYLLVITVSAAYTFYVALDGGDSIIRNTAFGEYDSRYLLTYGGFDFVYGLVVAYIILLVVLVSGRKRIKKGKQLIIIALMVLFALTIIASNYSTAFMLIMLGTIFIAPQKNSTRIILLALIVLALYVFPLPLTRLIESIPYMPRLTSYRINELILSFSGQGSSAYLTDDGQRLDRILWSIQAFMAHPILGVFGSGDNNVLGYHTEWIEQLARYGLFTAIFNTSFWVLTYKKMLQSVPRNSVTNKCMKSAFLVYLVLGFLNPISMVVTSAPLFVLCPFAENLFMEQEIPEQLSPVLEKP